MKRSIFTVLTLLVIATVCEAQTKHDSLNLQQKLSQFQKEINEANRLEIAMKEQKAKAYDAWVEYTNAELSFQQQVQKCNEEKKSKSK